MAGNKTFTELTTLATVDKDNDWMAVVDVSDTSASVYGTTKKANVDQFIGEKGDAATVDAGTTTTGAAGTDASVVNSGTTSAAIFDFTIPRGDKGEQGPQGPQGEPGEPGEDGLDITWRGTYSASTSYVVNDAVYYNGGSYICIQNTTGNLPTNDTYWNLMAAQGAPGEGSGDVVGPDGATDNAIARFDLATGKLIQNSLATVSDSGSINIPAGQQYLVGGSPVEGYSDEQAQDAVGSILTDTAEIDLTYNDTTPSITASIKAGSIDETKLDTSVNASLDLADSAIQSTDLATVATTGSYSDLSGTPDLTTKLDKATNVTAINDTGIADGEIAVFNLTNKDIRTSDKTLPSGAVVGTTDTQALSNKTLTSPVINTGVSGTAILDEDNMASNSATKLATQQSIKAYVDSKGYTWKGEWATSTTYAVNDTVEYNGSGYICIVAHTSGTFATDLSAGKWEMFVDGVSADSIASTIHGATAKTTPVDADEVGLIDSAASNVLKKLTWSNIKATLKSYFDSVTTTLTNKTLSSPLFTGTIDGWISAGETWTYASADDPTYTFTISGDKTSKYSVGMKIKLTQGTVKYFIITAVSYSSPNTTITVYGGTDYDLANSAISANAYSMMRTPAGFPMSPAKWSVELEDTTNRTQSSPANNTWYNLGSLSLTIPIGVWNVFYNVCGYVAGTTVTSQNIKSTLSTANNSESDATWTSYIWCSGASGNLGIMGLMSKEGVLTITEKSVYYLNAMKPGITVASDIIGFYNASHPCIIRATCAYL